MSYRQEPLINGQTLAERRRKPSAVVSRAQLAKTRGWFERVMGATVLLASYLGTLFTYAGGIGAFLADPWQGGVPWGWALLTQGLLTALQWWYKPVSILHPIYLGSFAVDTGLTTWGYGWVIAPPLAVLLYAQHCPQPALVAWLLVALGSGLIAWYPEHTFVD